MAVEEHVDRKRVFVWYSVTVLQKLRRRALVDVYSTVQSFDTEISKRNRYWFISVPRGWRLEVWGIYTTHRTCSITRLDWCVHLPFPRVKTSTMSLAVAQMSLHRLAWFSLPCPRCPRNLLVSKFITSLHSIPKLISPHCSPTILEVQLVGVVA